MTIDSKQNKIEQMLLRYRPAKVPDNLARRIFGTGRSYRMRLAMAITSAAAIIIGAGGLWSVMYIHEQTPRNVQEEIAKINSEIFQAGESSMLLALADTLNVHSDVTGQARRIYKFVLREYPGFEAAKTAQTRLNND
jgi:hypothetical protein